MSDTKVLHVTLPIELARMVEEKVASGEYANESEVVRDALEAPEADAAAIERWLREEVVPTLDKIRDGRTRVLSVDEARREIDAHIARRRREAESFCDS